MLAKILDLSQIESNDQIISGALKIDLDRIKRLRHDSKPEGTTAFKIIPRKGFYVRNTSCF